MRVSVKCGNVIGETVDVIAGDLSAVVIQRWSSRCSGFETKGAV